MTDKASNVDQARAGLAAARDDAEAKRKAHAEANEAAWVAHRAHKAAVEIVDERQRELDAAIGALAPAAETASPEA